MIVEILDITIKRTKEKYSELTKSYYRNADQRKIPREIWYLQPSQKIKKTAGESTNNSHQNI